MLTNITEDNFKDREIIKSLASDDNNSLHLYRITYQCKGYSDVRLAVVVFNGFIDNDNWKNNVDFVSNQLDKLLPNGELVSKIVDLYCYHGNKIKKKYISFAKEYLNISISDRQELEYYFGV